jgi:hypothetical protein
MYGVFRTIDPPPPHRPASVYPPAFGAGGGHTRWVEREWGVNSSEDARHCSVLYICKSFVVNSIAHSNLQIQSQVDLYNVSMAGLSAFPAHQYVFYGIN